MSRTATTSPQSPDTRTEVGTTSRGGTPNRWIGLWVLATGLALIILDGTIVGVALPTIIGDLNLDLTQAQWVNSLYSVVFAALLLTTGRLGDRWGRKSIFLAGLVVFAGGSALAALSGDSQGLIWARVVQGLGGAMILPSTLSTVNATFTGKDRAAAFGVWGAVMSGAAALGPLLGGWLTHSFDWRWIFWVNLPIAAVVLVAAIRYVPQTRGKPAGRGVDVDGLLTSAIGFGALVFALIEGSELGWWQAKSQFTVFGWDWPFTLSPVPVMALVGVLFVALFIVWERHRAKVGRDALLDLDVFAIKSFSVGNVTALMVAIGEFALVLLLPLYLMNVAGLGVLNTGFVLAAMALGAFFSGASARHLAARLTPVGVVIVGLALEVIGTTAVALAVGAQASVWWLAAFLIVYGVGLGLASAQLTSTVLGEVPTELSGQGSATQSTVRQIGSALGSAAGGTALAAALAYFLPRRLAEAGAAAQSDQLTSATIGSVGGNLNAPLPPEVLTALQTGFSQATQTALLIAAAMLLLGLVSSIAMARLRIVKA